MNFDFNPTGQLKELIEKGIIDKDVVCSEYEMSRRKELLQKHTYNIWQGKDGEWYTYLPSEKGRKLKHRKSKKAIEDVVIEYYGELEESPTVKALFIEWNDRQLKNGYIKPNTYDRNAKCFIRHLSEWEDRKVKTISCDDWIEFLEEQIPKFKLSYKGFCCIRHIVEGIILRAKRNSFIDYSADDVTKNLEIPKNAYHKTKKKDLEEAYTDTEMKLILDYTVNHRDAVNDCITLIFNTGMRVGEATSLQHNDLDPKELCISVNKTESRWRDEEGHCHLYVEDSTKTEAGTRLVYLPKQYQYLITSLWWNSSQTEYVFMNKGKRLISNTVRNRLRKICKDLNIPYKSPHKMRKAYASKLFEMGVDKTVIISQMGHTEIGTADKFYRKDRTTSAEKIETLSKALSV